MTFRAAVLDVDGTVLRGDRLLPGADRGLAAIDAAGLRRLFVSNNPTKAPPAYADRLRTAGVDADPEEILTAGTVTADYLRERHAGESVFVVGEAGLLELLEAVPVTVVEDAEAADVVVASIDRAFGYDDMAEAMTALRGTDVTFLGTDPDVVIPAADRDVPGSGAVVNAVAGVAGRDPEAVLGKPHASAQRMILDRLDVPAADCLVVGDRLDTDVELGIRAGMTTALVRTGVTGDADLATASIEPDYVLDSLADVADLL
jgi:4-nitrophenyl phosphatase